jgi:MoaA/NifB/PqqE/SkfB family radical SAM enzyme
MRHPVVDLQSLDTLWFQVGGTLCNLACTHCLVSSSPTNRTHEMMTASEVAAHLDEAAGLGVKEYYFTGGEPFLNPEMEEILARTLRIGPATVLTNGLLLDRGRCGRLARLADAAFYSLDLRVSLDGLDAASNDAIRGTGTFRRALNGVSNLLRNGINPVLTVTEVCSEVATDEGKRRLYELLAGLGATKPRLKVLPVFHIGAEAERGGGYADWQRLTDDPASEEDRAHLQCSGCRVVTDQGVWVCPILVNEPGARMGGSLAETLGSFPLSYRACWTCHARGASCRT